ncbi:ejaculatory bulb-specific protein 3-like [Leptidea sinapis]|uniref:ejaculatory bulb-specific protein 3-like n=1 Tax=Leptidea sinapis TaxID=189913 RepID=UPI00213CEAB7|nr:ejaculatory bulb-specific protein 3-like [Leptidea sinapis]
MNLLIVSVLVVMIAATSAEQYTDRYDNINIDEILSNKKLLHSYMKCLLDHGRCTPEGKELKAHIIDAIQTSCSKCTEMQRKMSRKVVNFIKEQEKTFWEDLKHKYDPGDVYKPVYESFLAADD